MSLMLIRSLTAFITQLGNHDYSTIMRRMRLKEEPLRRAINLIQMLNPYPYEMQSSGTQYVMPDVLVSKRNGRWTVELNPDTAPATGQSRTMPP